VRAARFAGQGLPIEVTEVPDPSPGPGEVVVDVAACGVCASDLHAIDGEVPLPVPPPLTMGHEAAGTIRAVGPDVPVWREGRRVALMMARPCLACDRCAAAEPEECLDLRLLGFHADGAWAEQVLVPWSSLAAVPDGVAVEHAAIASDAVATPLAALVDRGGLRPGERVGLWGIGGLGTHAVQLARLAGAASVVAVDPLPAARERALALGADAAVDPSQEDVPAAIRTAGGGRPLDLALDLIGRADAVKQALLSLRPGGRVVMVGQSFERIGIGPAVAVSFRRLSVLGHLGYRKRHLEAVLDLLASGRLDLSASISERYPLDRVNEAVDRLRAKDGDPVRLVVLPTA
jgi:D-arabinose 1-dehydrogenase-like Zn-dependent alcohol dehydrogenase